MTAEIGPRHLDAAALAALVAAPFPGNVRELRNAIRRAAILTAGRGDGRIDAEVLELPTPVPFRLGESNVPAVSPSAPAGGDAQLPDGAIRIVGRTFDEIEREVFAWALRRNAGSRRRAARALAVARSTFCDKVKRYAL